MSIATRHRRAELARHVLEVLGGPSSRYPVQSPDDLVSAAEAMLCQRLQDLITRLHEQSGVTKARIAREMKIDPSAVGDLADGGTARVGFETLWEGFSLLITFIARVQDALTPANHPATAHAELLGFSAHPDRSKVKGADALAVIVENVKAVVSGADGPLRPVGPDVKGASAVFLRDGRWFLVAEISEGPPAEMARAGRDELWHFQQWIDRQDSGSDVPRKPRSAF